MSHRIDIILYLLRDVKAATSLPASHEEVREHRISVTKRIAEQRQCRSQSIMDTYRDQLQPDVYGVEAFESPSRTGGPVTPIGGAGDRGSGRSR
jgi:hypothetical protein